VLLLLRRNHSQIWCDLAEAVVKAVDSPSTKGKVYELGGPPVYRYKELVELVLVHLKRRRLLVPVPFFVWEIQATLVGILPTRADSYEKGQRRERYDGHLC
jgi:uncharacterized protein YbjT (DUF2867 family)